MSPSLIAFGLLFVETSINITYFKDCIFGLTVFFIYIGIFWVNRKYRAKSFKPLMSELLNELTSPLHEYL